MTVRQRPKDRRVYLQGLSLSLPLAAALIADARRHGDGLGDALERALGDVAQGDRIAKARPDGRTAQ